MDAAAALLAAFLAADLRSLPEPVRPDPAPVSIGGAGPLALSREPAFELLPGGSLDPRDHAIEIHPKALLGAGWEENPLAVSDGSQQPDTFLRAGLGADLRLLIADASRLDVAGEAILARWAKTAGRDATTGELRSAWTTRRTDGWWRAGVNWRHDQSPLAALAEIVPYDVSSGSLAGGQERRLGRWWGSATASRTRYREDTASFRAADYDQDRLALAAGAERLGWGGSAVGLVADLGSVNFPHSDTFNAGTGTGAALRWRHAAGDRSWLTAEGGASYWRWKADTARDPGNQDRELLSPRGALRIDWTPEENSDLGLGLRYGLSDGAQANAATTTGADVIGRLRLHDRTAWFVRGGWERRLDSGAQPNTARELRINLAGETGVEYELRDGLGLRLRVGGENTEARIGPSFSSWHAALETGVAF